MNLPRCFSRAVDSVSDVITLRRFMLTLALISTFVVAAHITHVILVDLPLFHDGLMVFCYVIVSYFWVSHLVVCCRDYLCATAAADREVLMAEIASLRRTVNDIAYGPEDAQLYSIGRGRDSWSRFDPVESKRN